MAIRLGLAVALLGMTGQKHGRLALVYTIMISIGTLQVSGGILAWTWGHMLATLLCSVGGVLLQHNALLVMATVSLSATLGARSCLLAVLAFSILGWHSILFFSLSWDSQLLTLAVAHSTSLFWSILAFGLVPSGATKYGSREAAHTRSAEILGVDKWFLVWSLPSCRRLVSAPWASGARRRGSSMLSCNFWGDSFLHSILWILWKLTKNSVCSHYVGEWSLYYGCLECTQVGCQCCCNRCGASCLQSVLWTLWKLTQNFFSERCRNHGHVCSLDNVQQAQQQRALQVSLAKQKVLSGA